MKFRDKNRWMNLNNLIKETDEIKQGMYQIRHKRPIETLIRKREVKCYVGAQ